MGASIDPTSSSAFCPLCKKPFGSGAEGGSVSRLCDDCKAMVDNLRPSKQAPNQTTGMEAAVNGAVEPVQAQAFQGQPQPLQSQPQAFQGQPQAQPQAPQAQPQAFQAQPQAFQGQPQAPQTQPQPFQGQPIQEPPAHAAGSAPTVSNFRTNSGQNPASDFRQIAEAAGARVPAGPPVFLVPEGGQSTPHMPPTVGEIQNSPNWPIIVEPDQRKGRSKTWILVTLAILVGVGGGAYFAKQSGLSILGGSKTPPSKQTGSFNSQTRNGRPGVPAVSPSPPASVTSQSASSPKTAASINAAASPAATATPSAQKPQSTPSPQPTPQAQPNFGPPEPGVKYTAFQLASFPNQAGANEFLQKLVRATIPGYIVAAEIPHRGRWYRVRAGRFSNAKEQKEAGDNWRQRARAAGIDIQLVPCDYDPPLNGK